MYQQEHTIAGQTAYCQMAAAQLDAVCPPPPARPRLDECADQMEKSLAVFSLVVGELESQADRLMGQQPPSVGSEGCNSVANGSAGRIEMHADGLGKLVGRLHRVAERFESL